MKGRSDIGVEIVELVRSKVNVATAATGSVTQLVCNY